MERYVVTGGAGAIGSRLVRYLLAKPAHVQVIDNLSSGHNWLLPDDGRLYFEPLVDISREDLSFDPQAGVFHLAAHFANENSVAHPEADLLTNGLGTLRVFRAAVAAKASFVAFASAGCAANHEDTPYQIHKTLGEAYCRYFNRDVPSSIYRFHNSYGPGEVPGRYRNVIPNFIWRALRGEDLILFRNGEDARDFVFVDDLVEVLARPDNRGSLIEIGTGRLTRIGDIARMIVAATKSKSRIVPTDRARRWDHPGKAASYSPEPRGGWTPIEEGIERTVKWFGENYDRIRLSAR